MSGDEVRETGGDNAHTSSFHALSPDQLNAHQGNVRELNYISRRDNAPHYSRSIQYLASDSGYGSAASFAERYRGDASARGDASFQKRKRKTRRRPALKHTSNLSSPAESQHRHISPTRSALGTVSSLSSIGEDNDASSSHAALDLDHAFPDVEVTTPNRAIDWSSALGQFIEGRMTKNVMGIVDALYRDFAGIAVGEWSWLQELEQMGLRYHEIAELLIERERDWPWIMFEPWIMRDDTPNPQYHTPVCAHIDRGRQSYDTAMSGLGLTTLHHTPTPLAAIEKLELRRTVASLCGLAGVRPVETERAEIRAVDFMMPGHPIVKYDAENVISKTLKVITALCTAIAKAQQSGCCCERFTFLHKIDQGTLLQMRSIAVEQIVAFQQALQCCSEHGNSESHDEAHTVARSILHPLISTKNALVPSEATAEKFIALAAQFLAVAFVSYMQAHCGNFDLFFLEHEIVEIDLCGTVIEDRDFIRVSSEKLSCLDRMLDSKTVMAFELNHSFRFKLGLGKFDVQASADDLLDTWGPGNMTLKWKNPREADSVAGDSVVALTLRGGVIHARQVGPHHWTPLAKFDEAAVAGEWARSQRIRVGAQIDVNPRCTAQEIDHLKAFEGLWKPLGTSMAYWKTQEKQIGLQGGQYVTMVYNSTWDKVPGIRLKTQMISDLDKRIEYFAFLNACCGLQVSACSGLARRVTMRELLSDLLPTFISRQASVPTSWRTLLNGYDPLGILASDDFRPCQQWFSEMSEKNPAGFDWFWRWTSDLVKALELTGLQSVGDDFVVGFIPSDPAEYLRRISIPTKGSNLWLKVLRDSETSATFAYLTPKCLQLDGKGCQQAACGRGDQIHFLQTNIQLQLTGSAEKGFSADSWHLKDKETHFFRAKDDNKDIVLSATVLRDATFDDPRLLVKESLIPLHMIQRMFRRQNQRYIQENLTPRNSAQRAFVTSSPEAEPWFTKGIVPIFPNAMGI